MGYSTVHVDDIEGAGPGNAVHFVPNTSGHEHDESETQQEEVNVVVLDGMTMIGIGAHRGSDAPRGPF